MARLFALPLALALSATVPAKAQTVMAAATQVEVDVLSHPVMRGDRITPADFMRRLVSSAEARGVLDAANLFDVEAVRAIPAGRPLRPLDVQPLQLVHRGEPVSILLVSGPLTITASGRALANGRAGDPVRVFSIVTGRTLDGVVAAQGKVQVIAP